MYPAINLKERIVSASKSLQNYRAQSPSLLYDLTENSQANTQPFLDTIYGIITSTTREPNERFYALYLLLKASENNPDEEFLIKLSFKEELTSYISQTAQYDMDKVLPVNERGKTYFSKSPSSSVAKTGVNYVRLCAETIFYWGQKFGKSDANNIFYNFWFQNQIVSKRVNLGNNYAFIQNTYQGTEELATIDLSKAINNSKSNTKFQEQAQQPQQGPVQRIGSQQAQGEPTGIYDYFKKKDSIRSQQGSDYGADFETFEGQGTIAAQNKAKEVRSGLPASFQTGYQETVIKPLGQPANRIGAMKNQDFEEPMHKIQSAPATEQTPKRQAYNQFIEQSPKMPAYNQFVEQSPKMPAYNQFGQSPKMQAYNQFAEQNYRETDMMNLKVEKEIELKKSYAPRGESPKSPNQPMIMPFTQGPTLQEQRNVRIQRLQQPEQVIPRVENPFGQNQNNDDFKKIYDRTQSLAAPKYENNIPELYRVNSEDVRPNRMSVRSEGSQNSQRGQKKSIGIVFSDRDDEEPANVDDSLFYREFVGSPSDLMGVVSHGPVRAAPAIQGKLESNGSIPKLGSPTKSSSKPAQIGVESPVQDPYRDPQATLDFYQKNPQILMNQNDSYKQENTYLMNELAKYQEEMKKRDEKEKFMAKQNHFLKARVSGFDQELSEMRKTISKLADSNQQLHQDLVGQSGFITPQRNSATMGQFLDNSPIRFSEPKRKTLFENIGYERPSAVLRSSGPK